MSKSEVFKLSTSGTPITVLAILTVLISTSQVSASEASSSLSASKFGHSVISANSLVKRQAVEGNERSDSTGAFLKLSLVADITDLEHCNQGLRHSGVRIHLEYRIFSSLNESPTDWKLIEDLDIKPPNTTLERKIDITDLQPNLVQFRLRQLEHGGGRCGCWSVCQFMVNSSYDQQRYG